MVDCTKVSDIILGKMETYFSLLKDVVRRLESIKNLKAKYVMKTDDDTFVRMDSVFFLYTSQSAGKPFF